MSINSPSDSFYRLLHEEVEFDRGSRWTRIKRSIRRRIAQLCSVISGASRAVVKVFPVDMFDENKGVLAFNVVGLVLFTSSEPILLKIMSDHAMVDELRDYRYMLALVICAAHVPLVVVSAGVSIYLHPERAADASDFPKLWLVLLAFLNSAQLLLLIISSGKIPAPLIIILLQMTVPFTTILSKASQVISPQSTPRLAGLNTVTRDSLQLPSMFAEWYASLLILAAVVIAVVPVVTKDKSILGERSLCYEQNTDCVISVVMFALAALPASLSTVLEQRALVEHALPLSPALLHGMLVPLQFVISLLLAPIAIRIQHPQTEMWNLTKQIADLEENFHEGLQCIFAGEEVGIGLIGHSDPNWCKPLLALLVVFVLVSLLFHYFTLSVLHSGGERCLRYCNCVGIVFAFLVLSVYDREFQAHVIPNMPHSEKISFCSIIAMLFVVVAMYFHQSVEQPGHLIVEEDTENRARFLPRVNG